MNSSSVYTVALRQSVIAGSFAPRVKRGFADARYRVRVLGYGSA
jgi:hypothetical protein